MITAGARCCCSGLGATVWGSAGGRGSGVGTCGAQCVMCGWEEETLEHFLEECEVLHGVRVRCGLLKVRDVLSFGGSSWGDVKEYLEENWSIRRAFVDGGTGGWSWSLVGGVKPVESQLGWRWKANTPNSTQPLKLCIPVWFRFLSLCSFHCRWSSLSFGPPSISSQWNLLFLLPLYTPSLCPQSSF